jgi:polar amino acid transport system substrate-binding protein
MTDMRKALATACLTFLMAAPGVSAGFGRDLRIPRYWDPGKQISKPGILSVPRIRFLTTTDFPPFNFVDKTGHLAGYNVDLARAICSELEVSSICQVEAVPWADLTGALDSKEGEAIIAGLRPTAELRAKFLFTRSYLRLPARFVVRRDAPLEDPTPDALAGKRVGVVAGSAHEAMLRAYFPQARLVTYADRDRMAEDLTARKTDAVFGDGMWLSFWIAGGQARGCCGFAGGPYTAPQFLGEGLTIALRSDEPQLADAFDHALRSLEDKGVLSELYLRYFPVGFY